MLENLYLAQEYEILSTWIGGIVRVEDKVPQLTRYKVPDLSRSFLTVAPANKRSINGRIDKLIIY